MLTELATLSGRVRSSLFFVPMAFVVGGIVVGEAALLLDASVDGVPSRLTATVDSARAVLSVVAGATLAFAGIAFSVSLLLISLASSQYSPRVVHGLFRDPFNKRVMGIVIGTFTYSLVVMRAVRGPLEDSGEPIVPSISTLLAVLFGIVAILAIVAFINHGAHSMDVSKILHKVTEEAIGHARRSWPAESTIPDEVVAHDEPGGFVVRSERRGYIQQIDYEHLLAELPGGSRVSVEAEVGSYAFPGTTLYRIWPGPASREESSALARRAVVLGQTRTMQQDVTYGVRQLADVALKAMSPGINDPTTAQDALHHLGSLLSELLRRTPPPRQISAEGGRKLFIARAPAHADLVGLALDELRIASASQPTVLIYMLEVIRLVMDSLDGLDRPRARDALNRQADLILTMNSSADVPPADRERVRAAYMSAFRG